MTDNEIIKAFEVLDSWQRVAFQNIDGTDEESPKLFNAIKVVKECFNRQQLEISKLQSEKNRYIGKTIINARNEAIKDFADMFKAEIHNFGKIDFEGEPYYLIGEAFIDNLVKRLAGEDK